MIDTRKICIIICYLVVGSNALVQWVRLEKGANGCKGPQGELAVGEEVQDELTCGILVCQDTNGNAVYHFCQKPATFANCENPDTINTKANFPDCCWQCVVPKKCEGKLNS